MRSPGSDALQSRKDKDLSKFTLYLDSSESQLTLADAYIEAASYTRNQKATMGVSECNWKTLN